MDGETFAEIVQNQLALCDDVLVDKGREYATEDRLHNFKVAATVQDITPMEALGGMMAKHTVSIYDMIASPEDFPIEQWSEKITDHINYLILLRAVVAEKPEELTMGEFKQAIFSFLRFPENANKPAMTEGIRNA